MTRRRPRATPTAPTVAAGDALAPVDSPTGAALIEAAYAATYDGTGEPDAVFTLLCCYVGVSPAVAARAVSTRSPWLNLLSRKRQAAGQRARRAQVAA